MKSVLTKSELFSLQCGTNCTSPPQKAGQQRSTEGSFPSLNEEKCCLCSILGTPLMQKYSRTKKEAGILNLSAGEAFRVDLLSLNPSGEQAKGTNLLNSPT